MKPEYLADKHVLNRILRERKNAKHKDRRDRYDIDTDGRQSDGKRLSPATRLARRSFLDWDKYD